MYYLEEHFVLRLLYLGEKAQQYFVSSRYMFWNSKLVAKLVA